MINKPAFSNRNASPCDVFVTRDIVWVLKLRLNEIVRMEYLLKKYVVMPPRAPSDDGVTLFLSQALNLFCNNEINAIDQFATIKIKETILRHFSWSIIRVLVFHISSTGI